MAAGARTQIEVRKRREQIALLYLEDWTPQEIAENSGIPLRTVQRDVQYINEHEEEFY